MPSARDELWEAFDAVHRRAGNPKAPKIHKTGLTHLGFDVPEPTIRGWIGKKRRVPRSEDQFIKVITVLRLLELERTGNRVSIRMPFELVTPEKEAWLGWLRRAATAENGATQEPADNETPNERVTAEDKQPRTNTGAAALSATPTLDPLAEPPPARPGRRPTVKWVAAGAVFVVAAAGVTWLVINKNRDDPATPLVVKYERGQLPDGPGPLRDGGPVVSCPPASTNKPDSAAEATHGDARAEYYRESNLFLVYDNQVDGRSAILQVTVPGVSRIDWYNTRGLTCGGRERPLPMVVDGVDSTQPLVYQVCIGQWGDKGRIPAERCGDPVRIDPAGR